jgi:hypothetical protein
MLDQPSKDMEKFRARLAIAEMLGYGDAPKRALLFACLVSETNALAAAISDKSSAGD